MQIVFPRPGALWKQPAVLAALVSALALGAYGFQRYRDAHAPERTPPGAKMSPRQAGHLLPTS